MSENFRRLYSHPTYVRAQHVGYSVRMVAEIAAHYNEALDASDYRLARCMLDAFYVHIRLLSEFLLRAPKKEDFAPADFGVVWTLPSGPGADRLNEAWEVASKYVVHFGGRRVPSSDDASAFVVDGAHFRQLADDAVGLFSAFVDAMAATTPEWTWGAGALIPNPDTDAEGWLGRARAEALRELRDSLAEAKADLAS